MKIESTPLAGLYVIEPRVFNDARGWFMETFHELGYGQAGLDARMVQANHSQSRRGTVRGLHFQHPHGQVKLVRVVQGEVFDAVVDIRRGSPTFGQSFSVTLSAGNRRQLWVPHGFAHGFCVTSETSCTCAAISTRRPPNGASGGTTRQTGLPGLTSAEMRDR